MKQIHIIHENEQWLKPLAEVFQEKKLPFNSFFLTHGYVDLHQAPPEGIFFSKMSASSYTRGHAYSPDFAFALFAWLEAHGRRIINGSNALRLELSKMAQYIRLHASGIKVPKTQACFSRDDIITRTRQFRPPFILKPNRGGKGIGVQLFRSQEQLAEYLGSDSFEPSVDGITLIQEYIEAAEPMITRMEFIGGKFVYAVRVDTSEGFELCPAEACRTGPAKAAESCAIDADEGLFRILPDFNDPIVARIESFLAKEAIEVAGVEFIRDAKGNAYVYDINTNTNYNPEAEKKAGKFAIPVLTAFLRGELEAHTVS